MQVERPKVQGEAAPKWVVFRDYLRRNPMLWKTLPLFVFLVGYILYPLIRTFIESFYTNQGELSLANYRAFFNLERPANLKRCLQVLASRASVVAAAAIGIPLAFYSLNLSFPVAEYSRGWSLFPWYFPL